MDFVTTIIFFSAAFSAAVFVSGDDPLLGAKGLVGVRDCGTKNDLIKITSLTVTNCDKTPCPESISGNPTVSLEFVPLENIPSLSTTFSVSINGKKVSLATVDSCIMLTTGKCPFVKGETYVKSGPMDVTKLMAALAEKDMDLSGQYNGIIEILVSNPEKTSSVCASFETKKE